MNDVRNERNEKAEIRKSIDEQFPDLTEEDIERTVKLKEKEMLLEELYGKENVH